MPARMNGSISDAGRGIMALFTIKKIESIAAGTE
jgi:hypothetical protein